MGRIEVVQGDITLETVDAIVNAANTSLRGGGGVDGAIHRAAGPQLLEECAALGGCPTGECRVTRGYRLKARWVIHTVGPVWRGGGDREEELLASCYWNSMEAALQKGSRTLSFPSISTGVYGFPVHLAAPIALGEMNRFLGEKPGLERVRMVCFDTETLRAYQEALG
ncbi:MAG TPA: O-acetyl-ADP-ribose deacetylase [bacterium]|nr:O-acetyl-ADP-ribose deacetylase [bacterium]